jgi:RecA/RadA recombinase
MPPRKRAVEAPANDLDSALSEALEFAQHKYPDGVFTGAEDEARCLCLPVPALAPRVMVRQEGFPLGRFFLINGKKESCKSAFAYEVIRWVSLLGGKGKIIEAEDKRSPTLCQSIMRYNTRAYSSHYSDTMESWNEALTYWIHEFIDIMDGVKGSKTKRNRPGVGRIAPVCFLVDSITAAVSEATMENIEDEGHSSKHFAGEAGLLSDFLKAFTKWIPQYPFMVLGVNHLKPKADHRGFEIRNMPGGKAPEYHAALDIELKRMNADAKRLVGGREYIPLRMKVHKNSTAPKGEIAVDFWWYTDFEHPTETGECLQISWFDWDAASIQCILDAMGTSGTDIAKRLKTLTGIRHVGEVSQGRIASDTLEITADDPLNYTEAGQKLEEKIQADKGFRDELYPLLGVQRRYLFQKGIDYRDQIKAARETVLASQIRREKIISTYHSRNTTKPVDLQMPDISRLDEEDSDPFGDEK